MATEPRTDVHRWSEFVPGDYELLDSFDLNTDNQLETGDLNAFLELHEAEFELAPHPLGKCSVCGRSYRYAVIWRHSSGQLISTGQDCAATVSIAQADAALAQVHGLAKKAAGYGKLAKARAAFLETDRAAEAITYIGDMLAQNPENDFLASMQRSLKNYGALTERQLAAVLKGKDNSLGRGIATAARAAQRQEWDAARALSMFVGEIGQRLVFTGTVQFAKDVEGTDYLTGAPTTKKLYGIVDANGNSIRLFYSGYAFEWEKGEVVTFKATVKKHETYNGERQTVVQRPFPVEPQA